MRKIILSSAALLAIGSTAPSTAFAADLPSIKEAPAAPAPTNDWHFEATINGWAPSVIANVGVATLPTASANVGFFKLLSKLNGVVPVSVVGHNENFIVGLDLYWSAVSMGASFHRAAATNPEFANVSASLRSAQTILTGFGGVRLPVQIADLSVYGIAGARYFSVNNTLGLSVAVPGYGLTDSKGNDWVDPIVGLTAHYRINDRYFLTGEGDIGGYSSDSVTWQTFGALGYHFTQSISTTVGFRALYVDYRQANHFNGSFRFQETLLGPQATINYAF